MKRQRSQSQSITFVALLGLPLAASANAGIPMLVLAWPAYVLALLPIIAIESHFGAQRLSLTWRELLPAVSIANVWSTFVGIPLGWAAMFVLEMVVGIGSSGLTVPDSFQKWLFPFYAAWIPAESRRFCRAGRSILHNFYLDRAARSCPKIASSASGGNS